ncbi:hypothetical protein R1flu_002262 [Riccia fluitans]|uniref:Uncharacterized protein n=1 Tax=Riccia fluitans TaxID=41844 RepID=A0ABD1Y8J1_9MARC
MQAVPEKEERDKYFGVLRKKKHFRDPQAPEWVVVIRGTLKRRPRDILNDVKIALEVFHTSTTIKLLKIVVSRLVHGGARSSRFGIRWKVFASLNFVSFRDVNTFRLMPRATCCVSKGRWHKPLSAHNLLNRTRCDEPLAVHDSTRSVEMNHMKNELTVKVLVDGIGSDVDGMRDADTDDKW